MIKCKNRAQLQLLDTVPWLTDKHSRKLIDSIYHTFREVILQHLPVKLFYKFFSRETGRPTKDIQSMLGLFILQALLDLTDAQAIDSFCFHDAFRYALDIPRNEYLAERTYYYYRAILLGQGAGVFEGVLEAIANKLQFDAHLQRKDSTLVGTWLKSMSKLELFRTTVEKFLKEIKEVHPIIFSRIPEEFRTKYLPKDDSSTWFAGSKPSQYQEKLVEAAKDVLFLIESFAGHASISGLKSFALLERLAKEQIQVVDEVIEVKLDEQFKGSALVNPHDPDARYDGHRKAVGYHVQVTETCSENKEIDNPKIITQIEVNLANTPDVQTLVPGIEKLEEAGLKPEILLTDNGYASDENHQKLKDLGVDHVCPPAGDLPDGFGVMDFTIGEDGSQISQFPMGKPCLENRVNKAKKATASYFDPEACRACPHSRDCPVKLTKRKARLNWDWKRPRLEARRRQFAEDDSVKQLYRQRSGGEAPMSMLKGPMGLARIRRRGFAKTTLAVCLAATALNVRRTHLWLLRKAEEAMSKSGNSQIFTFLAHIYRLCYAAMERNWLGWLGSKEIGSGFLWAA